MDLVLLAIPRQASQHGADQAMHRAKTVVLCGRGKGGGVRARERNLVRAPKGVPTPGAGRVFDGDGFGVGGGGERTVRGPHEALVAVGDLHPHRRGIFRHACVRVCVRALLRHQNPASLMMCTQEKCG